MKKNTGKPFRTGKRVNLFIWAVIILSCLYILLDPIDRYFHEHLLGLVAYKSSLESALDMLFALCAIIGLSNLTKYPLPGWILTNIAIAGFILSPIYSFCTGHLVRTNLLDLLCVMPIIFFTLSFLINSKNNRPKYWQAYLSIIFLSVLTAIIFIGYVSKNSLWLC